jgi:hypothetical protein
MKEDDNHKDTNNNGSCLNQHLKDNNLDIFLDQTIAKIQTTTAPAILRVERR